MDKIFTRVGASDNISLGESTFMVEMNESAAILNNITENSLVLLDEIGRGTSTYDGISIAWAIAEYLHQHPAQPKTLFATHYHELNEMTTAFERIKNFNVSVKELKDRYSFYENSLPEEVRIVLESMSLKWLECHKTVLATAEQKIKILGTIARRRRPKRGIKKEYARHATELFQLG